MKVIVSHDVDHLYPSEHHFSDLTFPKLWARSFFELIKRQISIKTFYYRFISAFERRMHRIPELCEFDKINGVKATYFFGMANALGMNYKTANALPWIEYVMNEGYEAGVHGCDYQNQIKIKKEHDSFFQITGIDNFGIRNHYVRYNEDTFNMMNQAGYLFDTSKFNKEKPTFEKPYKVGDMWEFPLALMDVYVIDHDLERAKRTVIEICEKVKDIENAYLTFLFHDLYYNKKCYPLEFSFYEWIITYVKDNGWDFISYKEAINELER